MLPLTTVDFVLTAQEAAVQASQRALHECTAAGRAEGPVSQGNHLVCVPMAMSGTGAAFIGLFSAMHVPEILAAHASIA